MPALSGATAQPCRLSPVLSAPLGGMNGKRSVSRSCYLRVRDSKARSFGASERIRSGMHISLRNWMTIRRSSRWYRRTAMSRRALEAAAHVAHPVGGKQRHSGLEGFKTVSVAKALPGRLTVFVAATVFAPNTRTRLALRAGIALAAPARPRFRPPRAGNGAVDIFA